MRKLFSRTDKEGVTITYYTNENNSVIWSDSSYPRNFKSLEEQLEEQNEGLPKTKRQYMTDEGKVVGYLTAKKLGIIT